MKEFISIFQIDPKLIDNNHKFDQITENFGEVVFNIKTDIKAHNPMGFNPL